MVKMQKLLEKLQQAPQNLKFSELEKILLHFGFQKRAAKGSHIRFTNGRVALDFPVHNGDCKPLYKKNLLKKLKQHNFLS